MAGDSTTQGDAAPSPADDIVDDARSAASGTRQAARWIAAALGGIPGLSIIAALVRAPGDAGFDALQLVIGVVAAAAGAVLGILAFAYVLTPVPLEDRDLAGFDMRRIPSGHPFTAFTDLTDSIDVFRRLEASKEVSLAELGSTAKETDGAATKAEDDAKAKEADAAAKPEDPGLKKSAADARRTADSLRAQATASTDAETAAAATQGVWSEQLKRREDLRGEAYKLKASDEVRARFMRANLLAIAASALVAVGVIFLALAPKPKAEEPVSPTLVALTLNDAGKKALDCTDDSLQGIRVGGTDSAPSVITFPTNDCPSKLVTFQSTPPESLGTVATVEAVPSPS